MVEPLIDEGAGPVASCDGGGDELSLNCLMAQATRGYRVLLAGLLAEIDLYPGQERVMTSLWEHGPQTQNALARMLGIDMSTMTKSLQRLERSGFVSRTPSPANRRISIVSTTPAGDALRPAVNRILAEANRRTTRGLTHEQTAVLSSLLGVVRGNLCREAAP
ncbi:DNA-binding MarR family transcriptional regulator [Streptosporangium becharense]|uniref:DNA-binding MarR family transcriptional regulator n=1 Tax=Streptosporangium becharense TaxID=1816182 RepID=A0A7W9IFF6_9ACTN|nr:MarR family winged helix-turn-helix transcriptional regulator [Streptosporangium becharense]MBB2909487.1 DNA-binding MarR family transcriptional regulator [Streptosporangium becharense]MBB5819556.1 DNA-binding MarR family transcriptional regulator [Streptosporangium becharense]